MGDMTPPDIGGEGEGGRIVSESLSDALSKRYLAYALSTITARALPDVRDGLKPVHRRLLHAMRQMKLDPRSGPKKCAKVVGEVMGNYHPHGDQAIYDALVRLAQDFAVRYPLIDGQGNFGNIDGDNAAAMRYTEARLTEAAEALLEGLNEDAVDFRPTYDGEDEEPTVLPGGFPNLLANGSAGIAVGMATNIPPHNAAECIDAALLLIRDPNATTARLLEIVKGPDFPTGGVVVEPAQSIREAYETGRGGFRVRARWHVEEAKHGQRRVVVTEIPYQVQKSKLVERLAEMVENRKLPLVAEVRDESAEDIRLVIEPKSRAVEPHMMMESVFRLSDLETRISLNMNVLTDRGRTPRVLGLKEVLRQFLDHRREVACRRAAWRLAKIDNRLEILAGMMIVYLNLDEVIRIIREEDDPKAELIRTFGLNDRQAEAILDTRLRALRKLEEMELKREQDKLQSERKTLKSLLASETHQWQKVADELKETRKLFDPDSELGRRRSEMGDAPEVIDIAPEALVEREPITVVLSERGWVRAMRGHGLDPSGFKFKEGDGLAHTIEAETTDRLTIAGSSGRFFTLGCDRLPGGRGHGEPLRLSIDLGEGEEVVAILKYDEARKLILASNDGYGFIVQEGDTAASTRAGKQVMAASPGARMIVCRPVVGDHVAVIGEDRRVLAFPLDDMKEMTRGKGVKLKGGKDGAVRDLVCFDAAEGLFWIDPAGRRHSFDQWREWLGRRSASGKSAPKGFPRSGRFL